MGSSGDDPSGASPAGARSVEACVFDVQRFSLHDGPGIRTTVFFKGCPLRCRWCQNPESLRRRPEIAFFAERCRGERGCLHACARGAIRAGGGERIARDRCDACGRCARACPHGALETIGRTVSVGELLDEVARDAPFYDTSGGGVTLSGGEPMLQAPFLARFVPRCRELGLSVVLQTCGAFRLRDLEPILPSLALLHFDLKIVDEARHRALTGASNRRILANARALAARAAPICFRLPVIPGHTDTGENLAGVARLLHELGAPRLVTLRGHALGQAKLPRLGFPLAPLALGDWQQLAEAHAKADEVLRSLGVEVAA